MPHPPVAIGIDPGLNGALCALDLSGNIVDVIDTPTAGGEVIGALIIEWVNNFIDPLMQETSVRIAIERVHSMPKQGVASSFKFGKAYGVALGATAAWPVTHVTPTEWKKAFRLNGKPKDAARLLAIEKWPSHAEAFSRKKDIDRAEAALIARHALSGCF